MSTPRNISNLWIVSISAFGQYPAGFAVAINNNRSVIGSIYPMNLEILPRFWLQNDVNSHTLKINCQVTQRYVCVKNQKKQF